MMEGFVSERQKRRKEKEKGAEGKIMEEFRERRK